MQKLETIFSSLEVFHLILILFSECCFRIFAFTRPIDIWKEKQICDYLFIHFAIELCAKIFAGVSANMKDKDKVKHLRSDYYCGVGLGADMIYPTGY